MAMTLLSDRITAPVNEFAQLSGLGVSTVWAMIKDKRLEAIAIGRRRLIVIDSYRRLIEGQRAAPVVTVMTAAMPRGRPRQSRAATAEQSTKAERKPRSRGRPRAA
jgi:excisionase family DNA binding protein